MAEQQQNPQLMGGLTPLDWADPDVQRYIQEQQAQRRLAISNALMQRGMEPMPGTQMAGQVAVRNSPLQGLARALSTGIGITQGNEANTQLATITAARLQEIQKQEAARRAALQGQQLQQPQSMEPAQSIMSGAGASMPLFGNQPPQATSGLDQPQQPQQPAGALPNGLPSAGSMYDAATASMPPGGAMEMRYGHPVELSKQLTELQTSLLNKTPEAALLAQAGRVDPAAAARAKLLEQTSHFGRGGELYSFGGIGPQGYLGKIPSAPEGFVPSGPLDANGFPTGLREVTGGMGAVAGSSGAGALGKARGAAAGPVQTFRNGQPTMEMNPFGIDLTNITGGGNQQPPSAASGATAGAPVVAPAALPRGAVPTGPQLGANTAAEGSAKQYVNDQISSGGYPSRMFTLRKSLDALQNATTGPGTEEINNVKSFLLAQSPDWLKEHLPGVDPLKIQSWDEAQKYLTQYALAQASSLGGEPTDSKLSAVLTGNANTHISNLAGQDVVRSNMALEMMNNALTLEAQKNGVAPKDYTSWKSRNASNLDVRVFAWDTMGQEAKQRAMNNMSPDERKNFTAHYNWAIKAGYMPGPQ